MKKSWYTTSFQVIYLNPALFVTFSFAFVLQLLGTTAFAQVSGTVFNDHNGNGVRENTTNYSESGVSGVVVNAYNAAGTLLTVTYTGGGTSTNTTGEYAVASASPGNVRLEFILPTGMAFASNGSISGTTVMFPNTATQHLGIFTPIDYCQPMPNVASICYVSNASGVSTTNATVLSTPLSDMLTGSPNTQGNLISYSALATQAQTGAVYGMVYHKHTKMLLTSAFAKVGTNLGSLGAGGIYKIDPATNVVTPYFNLASITGGASAGSGTTSSASDIGFKGLGDLALSEDGATLYTINLANKQLYKIPIGTNAAVPASVTGYTIPTPGGAMFTDLAPFALEFKNGKVYVGIVNTAASTVAGSGDSFTDTNGNGTRQTNGWNLTFGGAGSLAPGEPYTDLDGNGIYNTGNAGNLRAYVYEFDPSTNTFSEKLNFSLNYPRYYFVQSSGDFLTLAQGFIPWDNTQPSQQSQTIVSSIITRYIEGQQPWLTDIAFDGEDMILGFRSRTGDIMSSSFTTTGGEILRACKTSATTWAIENNGECGGDDTKPYPAISVWANNTAPNTQGPGSGEWYWEDDGWEGETSQGALAQIPGYNFVLTSMMDGLFNRAHQGFYAFFNQTGAVAGGRNLFQGLSANSQDPTNFVKANGLGVLEPLCDLPPLEIGNRVWADTDGDGIQDAGEAPISGVTVQLLQGATVIATATTDANGNYFFSNATGSNTASVIYGITQLQPNMSYIVRIPNVQGGSKQAALGTNTLTTANAGGGTPGTQADVRDSDGALVGNNAEVTVLTTDIAAAGANNHNFDFGFMPPCTNPTLSALTNQIICEGGSFTPANVTTSVTNGVAVDYQWYNNNGAANPTMTAIAGQMSATLTALPTAPGIYAYRVRATNSSDPTCFADQTVTLTILATPTVNNPGNQMVCHNTMTTAITFTGTADRYDWTNNTPSIGLAASGMGNIAAFTAMNAGASNVTATITVTPRSVGPDGIIGTADDCIGMAQMFTITVTPRPAHGTPTTNAGTCTGPTANNNATITIPGITNGNRIGISTAGAASYDGPAYAAPATTIVGGTHTFTGLMHNTQYRIRIFNGGNDCFTDVVVTTATISCACTNPILTALTNQTICQSGSFTSANVTTSVTNGVSVTYQWFNNNGAANPNMDPIGGQLSATLTVLPTAPGVYAYRVRATNSTDPTCFADQTVTLTILATPTVNNPGNQMVCHNTMTTAITFTGTAGRYDWTNNTSSIGLAASGMGNIPAFTAMNAGASNVTATITVTPRSVGPDGTIGTADDCIGTAQTFTITVTPRPANGTPTTAQGTCTGATANNDATITIPGITNGNRIGISTAGAASYDGPAYAAPATTIVGGTHTFTGLMHNTQYTIRIFNGADNCFTDVTITTASITCVLPPMLTHDKTGPVIGTQQPNGSYNVTYTITVTNSGGGAGTYSLYDTPTFDDDIAINGTPNFTTNAPGHPANPGPVNLSSINGTSNTLATGQAIAANVTHTYTLTYNVTLNLEPASGGNNMYTACGSVAPGTPVAGQGLFNQSRLDAGNDGSIDETDQVCGDLPYLVLTKTADAVTDNGSGNYTITYTLTVSNLGGAAANYTLTDTPGFDDDATITGASYTALLPPAAVTAPITLSPIPPAPSWGIGTANQAIAAGAVHTYTLTVMANVDLSAGSSGNNFFRNCVTTTTTTSMPGDAFFNSATLQGMGTTTVTRIRETCVGPMSPSGYSLGSTVFIDQNNNGLQDPTETGVGGVTMQLWEVVGVKDPTPGSPAGADGADILVPTGSDGTLATPDDALPYVSDAAGNYFFTGLSARSYYVVIPVTAFGAGAALELLPSSSSPAVTDTNDNREDGDDNGVQMGGSGTMVMSLVIALGPGEVEPTGASENYQGGTQDDGDLDDQGDMTVDFGFFAPVSVGDTTWVDLNSNGRQDALEPPLPGVKVTLFNAVTNAMVTADADGNAITGMTTTNAMGFYEFTNLSPGNYYVVFDISTALNPEYYVLTTANQGPDTDDSDADPVTGQTAPTGFLPSGTRNPDMDAGVVCQVGANITVMQVTTCSTRNIEISALGASITPNTLNGVWSTSGTGMFIAADQLTVNANFVQGGGGAAYYMPSPADIAAGGVTLTLTTNTPPVGVACPAASDTVQVIILKVDCGNFPWDGN